jgi:hypothetical protein
MKNIVLILILIFVFISSYSQTEKKKETKFDNLTSRYGRIIKFIDIELNTNNTTYEEASFVASPYKAKIRQVIVEGDSSKKFFLQIIKEDNIRNIVASIEYNDLLEIIEVMGVLKKEADYYSKTLTKENIRKIENFFTSIDDFKFGYYIDGGRKIKWYMDLETWRSNSLIVSSQKGMESLFLFAKELMDVEMKK